MLNGNIKYSLSVNKGTWHVSFRLRDEKGKVIQKCLSTGIKAGPKGNQNKRAADTKAREIVAGFENLMWSTKSNMAFGDYMKDYANRRKVNIQATTYDGYIHMINKYISPYFRMKLVDVKACDIENYILDLTEKGLSKNTILKHITLIKSGLKDAVINDLIKSNPADKVTRPRKKKPKLNYYKEEQLTVLINNITGTTLELPVILSILYGLRRSEVLGMRWSNINFEDGTITICEKITRQKDADGKLHDIVSDELKTESSNAVYYMNSEVSSYLKRKHYEQQNMLRETDEFVDYVCVNEVGRRLKLDYITDKFSSFLKSHNLPHIRFHDLRHSCLSLLAKNYTMKQVQDYARHANFSVTADIYSHIQNSDKLLELNTICESIKFNEDKVC